MTLWVSDLNEVHELTDLPTSIESTHQVDPFDFPDGDMAFGEGHLWITVFDNDAGNHHMLQMETDGTHIRSDLFPDGTSWGVEYFEGHVWSENQNTNKIRKIDPSDFSVVSTIPHPTGVEAISGLAFDDNGDLWLRGNKGSFPDTAPHLIRVDPSDGSELEDQTLPTGNSLGGIAWDDGLIWILVPNDDGEEIVHWDPSTSSVVDTYPNPAPARLNGITKVIAEPEPEPSEGHTPLRIIQRNSQQAPIGPRVSGPEMWW